MASPSSVHVAVFAYPIQGHIAPAMELSRKLAASGLTITFLNTEHTISRMQRSHANAATQDLGQHIRLVGLPDGLPLNHERNPQHYEFLQSVTNMQGVVEELLEKLVTEVELPVHCIIYDAFLQWMKNVAIKANIPRAVLWTSTAASYSIFLHIPLLLSKGIIPVKGVSSGGSGEAEDVIDFIPGLPRLRRRDLPGAIKVEDTSDWVFRFLHDQAQQIGNDVPWVLVNSIYELEKQVFDGLRRISPLHPVGPLIPLDAVESREEDKLSSGMKEEECLRWLDTQGPSSVLYVSFGTVFSPSAVEMKVLATGLEASRQPFLWVIRSDVVSGAVSDLLPEDFLSRTKERGLVIPWAPQVRVLSHPSVGAFLSHCGWNSTLESVYAGIPMITWPQFAEQATNARLIVEEWKMGVRLRECLCVKMWRRQSGW